MGISGRLWSNNLVVLYYRTEKYPVSYPLKDMVVYLILAAVLFVLSQEVIISNVGLRLVFRTLLLLIFIAYILKKDLPLKTIPFVNRFVK